jgi:nitroreductase
MNSIPRSYELATPVADATSVEAAISTRGSARGFLPTPVPRATLERLLELAALAPSGTNTQPWRIYVVQGDKQREIADAVCKVHDAIYADPALAEQYPNEYDYYPVKWFGDYLERRRENGWGLYATLGIGKADKDRMHAQHQRNYRFFGAPVGLFFTIDRGLGRGSLLDYGMFLQNFMVAARAHGLDTCPQGAWTPFAQVVKPLLGCGPEEMLVCGMCLGQIDPAEPANAFRATRVPVSALTSWL